MTGIKNFIRRWVLPPAITEVVQAVVVNRHSRLAPEESALLLENVALSGRHRGERCFILGAGPSIKEQDLTKLAGEVVISVSNTFVHPDYALIQPKYHVVPPIMASHGKNQPVGDFVNWLKAMEQGTGTAEMFFHIGDRTLIEEYQLFGNRTIHWLGYAESWDGRFGLPLDLKAIPPVGSVSEVAISVALYLGFDQIYLLGFDHDWFNGVFNYFYDHKTEHACKPDESYIPEVDSEYQMRRHADIFRKYKYLYSLKKNIYNANANSNSYVDLFPKVDFDSLFAPLAEKV